MPVCSLHLISLPSQSTIPAFLSALRSSQLQPLLVAKVIRWIITPNTTSVPELLQTPHPWHLFILLPSTRPLFPPTLQSLISSQWSIQAGIPSRLLQDFQTKNHHILHPSPANTTTPTPLTGALSSSPRISSSSQSLELSPDLYEWITSPTSSSSSELAHNDATAVSMLNLLAFHDQAARESYLQYGAAFSESIGSRRGGLAKVIGTVISSNAKGAADAAGDDGDGAATAAAHPGWDEIAVAHYPSIQHFGDMLVSSDYQAVNQKYRVPSLRDTAILCMSEGAVEGMWEKTQREGGRLARGQL